MCIAQSAGEPIRGNYGSYEQAVEFHGHSCGGLASGYRVAVAAMKALGVERPKDEELVAIAETNACGVDAIQFITGCTAGKGNFIIHDYGKHAFTFYCRKSNKAVRVVTCLDGFMPEEMQALRPGNRGRKGTVPGTRSSGRSCNTCSTRRENSENLLC